MIRFGKFFKLCPAFSQFIDLPFPATGYRGQEIAMIFQAAMNALNPVYKVGDQIILSIRSHADDRVSFAVEGRVAVNVG